MRCGQPAALSPVPHRLTQGSDAITGGCDNDRSMSRRRPPTSIARPTRSTAITWDRVGLAVLLTATAVMYLWNITINGMGNQFYAAAAQAGSTNWEALLFGSLDAAQLHHRRQTACLAVGDGAVRSDLRFQQREHAHPAGVDGRRRRRAALRRGGPDQRAADGLLAGAVLALTPVAALMFRFNNPDAVMVLLMTAAAYCTVRAVQQASAKWLAWAGVALGFAFLAKMLEGLMVAPALGRRVPRRRADDAARPVPARADRRGRVRRSRPAGSFC